MIHVEPANSEAHGLGLGTEARWTEEVGSAPAADRISRHPPENASEEVLTEWAVEEYYRLIDEGQPPDLREFCARFPRCRTTLLRILDVADFIGDHPEYLDSPASTNETVSWPSAGEQRGDWTIVCELGRGAFARVFLAREASTGDRPVVVKFSRHSGIEARTLGRLAHPHIVPILSAREEDHSRLTAVCMPYLGSATLEHVLARLPCTAPRPRRAAVLLDILRACARPEDPPAGPIHPCLQRGSFTEGVLHLAIPLAEALAFVHAQGLCHRDLKPSNVLLDPSGKPLLLDFNLSAPQQECVRVGGTLHYMAPEQLRAYLEHRPRKTDGQTDLFALAVIVCELLTGEHPFGPLPRELSPPALAQLLLQRIAAGPPALRRLRPALERPIAAILQRCLAADPADRPSGAAELAVELKRQFAPVRRLRRSIAARPRLTLAFLGLFTLVIAATGYLKAITPPRAEREFQAGRVAYQAGRHDEAEQHFAEALQDEPDNLRWRRARGWARLRASRALSEDAARDRMDQAWNDLIYGRGGELDPALLEVRAYLHARQQNPRTALGLYNQLAASGHRTVSLLNNRAFCAIQLASGADRRQLFAQAEEDLRDAAVLLPDCQAIFYNRATLALQRGTVSQQSLEDIERAIQLGPPAAGLYRDAALLYVQAADRRRAPVMLDAPIATAVFLTLRPGRIEQAVSHARQAIAEGQPPRQFLVLRELSPYLTVPEIQSAPARAATSSAELRLLDPPDGLD